MDYKITDFTKHSMAAYKQLFVSQNKFCEHIHSIYRKHFPNWVYSECTMQIELAPSDSDVAKVECNLPFLSKGCYTGQEMPALHFWASKNRVELYKQILGFIQEIQEVYGKVVILYPICFVFELFNHYFNDFVEDIERKGFNVCRNELKFNDIKNAVVIKLLYHPLPLQPLDSLREICNSNIQIVNLSIASTEYSFWNMKNELPSCNETESLTDMFKVRCELCKQLNECVKNWKWSRYGFHYYSMEYYHPQNRARQLQIDSNRRFIWDFKDGVPYATNEAVKRTEKVLREHFGELTTKLTLVCITASTTEKTHRRYKVFAEKICKDLGMTNAFSHIHILSNGISKHNCPDDLTPTLPALKFDEEFFEGKQVVLFDDVISSGWTINEYEYKLMKLGAKTICAITIGETV